MKSEHAAIIRALIAAQVAMLEYTNSDINEADVKSALIKSISHALKLAKKLD